MGMGRVAAGKNETREKVCFWDGKTYFFFCFFCFFGGWLVG